MKVQVRVLMKTRLKWERKRTMLIRVVSFFNELDTGKELCS
jgi:hypothetical protein